MAGTLTLAWSPSSAADDGGLMDPCGAADLRITGTSQTLSVTAMVIVELTALGLILLSLLVLPHLDG
jgi:hypothetical protein